LPSEASVEGAEGLPQLRLFLPDECHLLGDAIFSQGERDFHVLLALEPDV
jgi:hypothetical protein